MTLVFKLAGAGMMIYGGYVMLSDDLVTGMVAVLFGGVLFGFGNFGPGIGGGDIGGDGGGGD